MPDGLCDRLTARELNDCSALESVRDADIANVPLMASADGVQCQAQDAKFSRLNERITTTQCARQRRQKGDICDFRIPNGPPQRQEAGDGRWIQLQDPPGRSS